MTIRIATLVGSLRRESFDQDRESDPPEPVRRLKGQLRESQGVLFVTPEYNRSVPGVLKNAIDHASRPYGDSAWAGKPAGITGVSSGRIGTALAQQHLRNILAYLDMPTMGQPEAFIQQTDALYDANGGFGKESRAFLQDWMDHFGAWVRRHQPA